MIGERLSLGVYESVTGSVGPRRTFLLFRSMAGFELGGSKSS
jgi:hypothetical protein